MKSKKEKWFGEISEGEATVTFFPSEKALLRFISMNGAQTIAEFEITKRLADSLRRRFKKEKDVAAVSYSAKRFPNECGHFEWFSSL